MNREQDAFVRQRALFLCEYCRLPQNIYPWKFEIDHIIAAQHGGQTEEDNLALCCPQCNRNKGPNLAGVDPETQNIIVLFHPRLDLWKEHFIWNGPVAVGLTPKGRATIRVLGINESARVALRATLTAEGLFQERTNR